jgi:hypothetical protein
MRRDFAAFRVFRGSFRKLQTRKVTRKVAYFASGILNGPATKTAKFFAFRHECSTERVTCALKANAQQGDQPVSAVNGAFVTSGSR